MSAATELCPVVCSVDDNGTERMTLLGADASILGGAYKPAGHAHWRLYMSAALASVGSRSALMPAQHLLTPRRADACQWLELIGHLYAHPGHDEAPSASAPAASR